MITSSLMKSQALTPLSPKPPLTQTHIPSREEDNQAANRYAQPSMLRGRSLLLSNFSNTIADYRRLLDSLPLNCMDMRNYVTALTPTAQDTSRSFQTKTKIGLLWKEAFAVNHSQVPTTLAIEPVAAGDAKRLRIAVIGAGVAGSGAFSLLAKSGHDVMVFEKRRAPKSRENLVTVNPQGRPVLTKLVGEQAPIFQTDGQIGCSERIALKDIETALIESADQPEALKTGYDDFTIAYSKENPLWTELKAKPIQERGGTKEIISLNNLDLVVACSGARLATPYNNDLNFIKEHFSIQPVSEHESAMAFLKFRYSLSEGASPPQQREIDVDLAELPDYQDARHFVNLYTGRKVYDEISGERFYETSLLMDCPATLAEKSERAEKSLSDQLNRLAKQLLGYADPDVVRLARSILGMEPTAVKVQQGVAVVSLWYPESAVSQKGCVVGIGDAMAPPNPWTGSGSNIALRSLIPLNNLVQKISALKGAELSDEIKLEKKREILSEFSDSVAPLHREAVLRGLLASRIFSRANGGDQENSIEPSPRWELKVSADTKMVKFIQSNDREI